MIPALSPTNGRFFSVFSIKYIEKNSRKTHACVMNEWYNGFFGSVGDDGEWKKIYLPTVKISLYVFINSNTGESKPPLIIIKFFATWKVQFSGQKIKFICFLCPRFSSLVFNYRISFMKCLIERLINTSIYLEWDQFMFLEYGMIKNYLIWRFDG